MAKNTEFVPPFVKYTLLTHLYEYGSCITAGKNGQKLSDVRPAT